MKKFFVLILMMVLLAGTVTTVALPPVIEKCKTCGLPIGRCKYKGKHPAKQESSKPKKETSKPKKESSNRKQETAKPNRGNNSQSSTNRSTPSSASTGMSQAQRDRVLSELEANMVWVEGGTFTMGATSEQGRDAYSGEKPAHQVTLSGFYICKYEVTQELWQAVMGSNPSEFHGNLNRPVERVSWNDSQEFIDKLNRLTSKRYRLPTEAEWEYAARGGNRSRGYKYSGSDNQGSVAWYTDNSGSTTHPVGLKSPNELGLYDMSGNVWEWCADWYGSYSSGSQINPVGPSSGSYRVIRGGCWFYYAWSCRVSHRRGIAPTYRHSSLGLRLAL